MKTILPAQPSNPSRKRPAFLAVAALLPILIAAQSQPALADSDIENVVGALALTVASIRVTSENCKVDIDPILEARIFEAVATVPGIRMTEVSGLFIRSYENEVHFAGRECAPGDADRLPTLRRIYDTSLNTLRDLVQAKTSN